MNKKRGKPLTNDKKIYKTSESNCVFEWSITSLKDNPSVKEFNIELRDLGDGGTNVHLKKDTIFLDVPPVILCLICKMVFVELNLAFDHVLKHFKSLFNDLYHIDRRDYRYIQSNEAFAEFNTSVLAIDWVLQCEFCTSTFFSVSNLLQHSKMHDYHKHRRSSIDDNTWESYFINRLFLCNVCQKYFPSLNHLKNHRWQEKHFFVLRNRQTGKLNLRCLYCYSIFTSYIDFKMHMESEHIGFYICDLCNDKFYTERAAKLHKQMHYKEALDKIDFNNSNSNLNEEHSHETDAASCLSTKLNTNEEPSSDSEQLLKDIENHLDEPNNAQNAELQRIVLSLINEEFDVNKFLNGQVK